jgi:hypothetical protein
MTLIYETKPGVFKIEGTQHTNLTRENIDKLAKICAQPVVIFRDYSNPKTKK